MSTFTRPPLDFTVVREDWNRYDLSDNSILKVKIVLTRLYRNQSNYSVEFKDIVVVLTNERGQPDTRICSPQELQAAITNEVRYTTVSHHFRYKMQSRG